MYNAGVVVVHLEVVGLAPVSNLTTVVQRCKKLRVAKNVLKTDIFSSTLKKRSSLLQCWRCDCEF
jgi:hypothetical protein